MNKISTEKAIEVLYTVRAYYASLTVGYPKGKDCKGIGDVMCSEIANSCLMAIKALEQQPCEDAISRQAVRDTIFAECSSTKLDIDFAKVLLLQRKIKALPSVNPQPKIGHWIDTGSGQKCSRCGEIQYGYDNFRRFCANCGAKIVEPQESER